MFNVNFIETIVEGPIKDTRLHNQKWIFQPKERYMQSKDRYIIGEQTPKFRYTKGKQVYDLKRVKSGQLPGFLAKMTGAETIC